MPVQFSLPATWASNFLSRRDPRDRLATLKDDVLDTETEIRVAMGASPRKPDSNHGGYARHGVQSTMV